MDERAPLRTSSAARAVALTVMAAALLTSCSSAPEIPAAGPGEVWVIGIAHPRGEWSPCLDDESIAESLMSADMPSSRASATFGADAERQDVQRVIECLAGFLTGGTTSVGTIQVN